MKVNEPSQPWPCDWEGHELQQLRRDAACSFRENLQWLEDATEFAEKMLEARRKEIAKSTSRAS